MHRKNKRPRAFDPDPEAPQKYCDEPGCTELAGYRAPKDRQHLRQYYWFCLEHVRQYNQRWDFYKGMTAGQIEVQLRADVAWQRPSWKLGSRAAESLEPEKVIDPLNLLNATRARRAGISKKAHDREGRDPPTSLRVHLDVLSLAWPTTLTLLKTRYKELARRHHPDANHGDPDAEERFKALSVAYSVLRAHLNNEQKR